MSSLCKGSDPGWSQVHTDEVVDCQINPVYDKSSNINEYQTTHMHNIDIGLDKMEERYDTGIHTGFIRVQELQAVCLSGSNTVRDEVMGGRGGNHLMYKLIHKGQVKFDCSDLEWFPS